ncbi:hypothetical protein BDN72DRAFT_845730 [Pluteus cervinus]|uniref:Uncharacterized protein n=1 Tax=Pluteus cervinus TaxID=181527 RepID=A0ACD3AIK6_9AGAR|nr:hypothetical protein BDN72DRAFT_845730 [Pluteus cervinus]
MPRAELSVAIYTPVEHSKGHWAIRLRIQEGGDSEDEHLIFEAAGSQHNLALRIHEDVDPASSSRLSKAGFGLRVGQQGRH